MYSRLVLIISNNTQILQKMYSDIEDDLERLFGKSYSDVPRMEALAKTLFQFKVCGVVVKGLVLYYLFYIFN